MKKLKKFLRDNKVLTKFKLNCRNCGSSIYSYNFGYALDRKYEYYGIGAGFIWSDTPEGHKFWEDLQRKFEELQ